MAATPSRSSSRPTRRRRQRRSSTAPSSLPASEGRDLGGSPPARRRAARRGGERRRPSVHATAVALLNDSGGGGAAQGSRHRTVAPSTSRSQRICKGHGGGGGAAVGGGGVRCEAEQPAGEAPPGRRKLRAGGGRAAVLGVVATRSGPRDGWTGAASERRGWRRRKRMTLTPATKPTLVAASRCGATAAAAAPLDTGEDQAGAAALLPPRSRPVRESTTWVGCARGTAFRWMTLLLVALFPSLPYLHMCCLQIQMHMCAGDGLTQSNIDQQLQLRDATEPVKLVGSVIPQLTAAACVEGGGPRAPACHSTHRSCTSAFTSPRRQAVSNRFQSTGVPRTGGGFKCVWLFFLIFNCIINFANT
jgi:hypothetical protein